MAATVCANIIKHLPQVLPFQMVLAPQLLQVLPAVHATQVLSSRLKPESHTGRQRRKAHQKRARQKRALPRCPEKACLNLAAAR